MKKIAILIVSFVLGLSIQAQTTSNTESEKQAVVVKNDTSIVKPTSPTKKFDTSKIHHKSAIAPKEQKFVAPAATKVTPSQVKTPPASTKEEE